MAGKITYFQMALLLGLIFHAATYFFTFDQTYDAYVHIFFADHYAEDWFSSWNFKWYTGFTITSYPPLVHQAMALLSYAVGLKFAFYIWSILILLLLIRGVYHFSKLWVNEEAAGLAAILAVFTGSIVEALHIFGQIPSLTGVAFLLNACPEVYYWLRNNRKIHLLSALILLACTTAAHHVTTIFGMVFFVLPVMGLAIIDNGIETRGSIAALNFKDFYKEVLSKIVRIIFFGLSVIAITFTIIFAYWYWSKTDPISQVSIPHGSRASFLEKPDLAMIFFIIPWAMMLFVLPYFFIRSLSRRNIFLGLSLVLSFILGSGGTTPIPRLLLGDTAFGILTLDRFTFWATLICIPFFGEFLHRLIKGDFKQFLNIRVQQGLLGFLIAGIIISNIFIINISYFKPFQPESIDVKPISNFLARDQHDHWRYLTLGFGDQVAWLSANTDALTVDGNYHSARRLPEMTTRSVERLENAKYRGMQGIGALQQFLTVPEKYNLKYIFNNDKFYEPLLFFTGWNKIQQLENNIIIWERPDVVPLPKILKQKQIPKIQRIMWGVLPLSFLGLAIIIFLWRGFRAVSYPKIFTQASTHSPDRNIKKWKFRGILLFIWFIIIALLSMAILGYQYFFNRDYSNPENLITAYFDAVDFKEFEEAYSLLNPENRPTLEEYLLELSLEDGLLSSYAKLDSLHTDIAYSKDKNSGIATIHATWISSLNSYESKHVYPVKKVNQKWTLEIPRYERKTPPDQFISLPDLNFLNQGRRKANTLTNPADVLDRPETMILQANLIEKEGRYHIVGKLQNQDNVPSYLSVEAKLYNEEGNEIAAYNAKDMIKHWLLPNEKTLFRIDFESIEKSIALSEGKDKFDPNLKYYKSIDEKPTEFVVLVRSMASTQNVYKYMSMINIHSQQDKIQGEVYNYGTKEISLGQILWGAYEEDKIKWVDGQYLEQGVRPQRKKAINLDYKDTVDAARIIRIGKEENLFVNGIHKAELLQRGLQNNPEKLLNKVSLTDSTALELMINGFIYENK